MLPFKNRLKKDKDFNRILRKGKRFNEEILSLIILKNKLKETRIGLVVSKKISKKAVVRNKTKRRIYSLIRGKLLNIKNGFDLLIITKPKIKDKNFFEINKIIDKAFKKVKIIEYGENNKKNNL